MPVKMIESTPGLITVFGGAGFIGTQVVRALAQRGWRVRVATTKPARAWKLQTSGTVGQLQAVRCDISDPAMVAQALDGATAAINLVGVLSERGRETFQALHVDGAAHIAEACKAAGITRLVHVSALGADADSASAYARSKAEGEKVVRAARPTATIVRPSVVFGAGDGLYERFARLSTWSPVLPLIGGGQTRFQPVWVGDVGEAVARTLDPSSASQGQTYELGGPAVVSFGDVLQTVLAVTQRRRPLVPMPWFVAEILGSVVQTVSWIGMEPPLTADQVTLLKSDNVVTGQHPGLADLGIQPTAAEAIVEGYLWRFRKGGQFAAQNAPAELPQAG